MSLRPGSATSRSHTMSEEQDEAQTLKEPLLKKDMPKVPNNQWPSLLQLAALVFPAAMGVVFGYAIFKGGVYEPRAIRDQMVFRRFIMLKMFLGAAGFGQLMIVLVSLCKPEVYTKVRAGTITTTLQYATTALGAAMLGVGMTVSGACPGMVLAQVGSGVPNALWTLCGCLLGAASYGVLQPYCPLDAHTLYFRQGKPTSATSLDQSTGVAYQKLALGLSLIMLAFVAFLEWCFPYGEERPEAFKQMSIDPKQFMLYGWPPAVSGLMIGALQLPALLLVGHALGSSSSYLTAVGQFCPDSTCDALSMDLIKSKKGGYWQLVFVLGAVLGAYLASAPITYDSEGVPVPAALCGGVLLLWGARLAGGCTSGHGLSGFAFLSLHSIIAVCAMFGGAIATAFIAEAAGGLSYV
eukprot:g41343.t1